MSWLLVAAAIALSCGSRGATPGLRVVFTSPTAGATVPARVAVAVDVVGGNDPVSVTFSAPSIPPVTVAAPPFATTLALAARAGETVRLSVSALDGSGSLATAAIDVRVASDAVPSDAGGVFDTGPLADAGPLDAGAEPDAAPADAPTIPDAAPDTAPDTTPDTAPDTTPDTAPDTRPRPATPPFRLDIEPFACARVTVGGKLQLRAWGDYDDGSRHDLTSEVTWTASASDKGRLDPATATLVGVSPGKVEVTVALGGLTASADMTVASWHFTTLERNALLADFRSQDIGDGAAIWRIPAPGGRVGIAYRRYNAGGDNWDNLTAIDTGNLYSVDAARLGFTENDDMTAVWVLDRGGNGGEVWHVSRGRAQSNGRISRAGAEALQLGLIVDPLSTAFAFYSDTTAGGARELWAARFTSLDGWGQPVAIGSPSGLGTLAYDRLGNVRALWEGSAGLASRFFTRATDSWGPLEILPGSAGASLGVPGGERLAVDWKGNAVATWVARQPGGLDHVLVTRRTTGGSWSQPVAFNAPTTRTGDSPTVGAGADDFMVVTWQQHLGAAEWRIYARVHDPKAGWLEPVDLGPVRGSGPHHAPRIAFGRNGAAVWWTATDDIKLRLFHFEHGWGDLQEVPVSAGAQRPRVMVDYQCNVHMVWERESLQAYDTISARLR